VREGKLLPSFPLEGRKTETSSPFKGEAGGGWALKEQFPFFGYLFPAEQAGKRGRGRFSQ
jgi:hypothetical protein